MSSHEIHHLLATYGLGAEFVAVALQAFWLPIPGTTVLVAAAVYASTRHGLPIVGVILIGAAGVLCGGFGGFMLGRWRGEWVLLRLGRLLRQHPDRIQELRGTLDRHAILALFAARWFTGTRNAAGVASGASGMKPIRFLLISAAAALVWATFTGLEFYFFGGVFLGLPGWLQIGLIVVGLLATVAALLIIRRTGTALGESPP